MRRPPCRRVRAARRLFARIAPALFFLTLAAFRAAASESPPAPSEQDGAQPTIGLDEVRRGQKGYGLSVFAGTEPERFDVEVLGVMRNLRPEMSFILARLTGQGLERSGVIEGMSGSPVFLDGRLAGAVAFSWSFSHDAIAGVTPIGAMRELSGLKSLPPAPSPPPVKLAQLRAGDIPADLVERQLAALRPRFAEGATSSVQWSASGFGAGSLSWMRQALGSVGAAGQAAPGAADIELGPGRSVAVVLVDGDLQMSATGTVTDRYGNQVLAFGHPFLGLGPVRVPMATSEVVTVLSNQNNSFKISNVGRIVGAFEQDRQAGIQGRIGEVAPMFPMQVQVAGGGGERPREFRVRIAELPEFLPLLVGSTVLGSLESSLYSAGSQSLDLDARFTLARHGEVRIRQSFDGEGSGLKAASFVLSLVALLTGSPFERVDFEEIRIELNQSQQPRGLELLSAVPDRTVVHPGDRVRVRVDFASYRGERQRREVLVPLPENLGTGRYSLLVGDGASADGARLNLEPGEAETFAQTLAQLRALHSRRELVVLGLRSAPGLAVAGEPLPDLPGSVRSLWGAAPSLGAVALKSQILQEIVQPLETTAQGLLRIDLDVRKPDGTEEEEPPGNPTEGVAVAGREAVGPAGKDRGGEGRPWN